MSALAERRETRAVVLAVALGIHWALLVPYFQGNFNDFDARHLYLPLAERLLDQGLAFFATEASLQAPPFAYAFPALLGASFGVVRAVDVALSGVTLLLLYGAAASAHSRLAGLAAAAAFACCPLLKPYLAAPITEPPFLLLHAAWIWALARWVGGGPSWLAILAGIAAGLSVLTRATSFYWLVALAGLFFVLWMRAPAAERRRMGAPLVGHAAGLALPLAFIAKNWLLFAFPFFATGAGNALYLGNNPATGGLDPTYVGLIYDVGAIARDQSHLTLEAERLLRRVAAFMVAEQGVSELLRLHAAKLAAFVFVSNAEADVPLQRGWRVALVILAGLGLVSLRSRLLMGLIGGTIAYNVLVHVPVLTTLRYSVGALDLWLILLAGIGLARLFEPGSARAVKATIGVLAIGWAIGWWVHRYGGDPEPDAYAVARITIWRGEPTERRLEGIDAAVELAIRDAPKLESLRNTVLVLDARLDSPKGPCAPLRIAFRREGAAFGPAREWRLAADGRTHRHQLGWMKLGLDREGVVRLSTTCPTGATLHIEKAALVAPLGSIDFRERLLGEKPMFPLER